MFYWYTLTSPCLCTPSCRAPLVMAAVNTRRPPRVSSVWSLSGHVILCAKRCALIGQFHGISRKQSENGNFVFVILLIKTELFSLKKNTDYWRYRYIILRNEDGEDKFRTFVLIIWNISLCLRPAHFYLFFTIVTLKIIIKGERICSRHCLEQLKVWGEDRWNFGREERKMSNACLWTY